MITASIVIYKTNIEELNTIIKSLSPSIVNIIYIIDNSPTNELQKRIIHSEKIEYIFGQGNIGYGAAHNIGIKKAIHLQSFFHFVINPDIYFNPEDIDKLIVYMDSDKTIGQVLPKVTYPDGRPQYLCKLIPTPVDLIFKRFLPMNWQQKRIYKFQLRFTGYNKLMNVPYLSGCFMLFRVSALKEVGLFDERFFMYPEDIDITRRMYECYKTMFYPDVTIVHAHAAESYQNKRMLYIHISNMIKYFNKWGWFFDKKRRDTNKKVLLELGYNKK